MVKMLRESNNADEAERRRQMMLARLKRDQRRAKQEERFDAAAVLMGLAKQQQNKSVCYSSYYDKSVKQLIEFCKFYIAMSDMKQTRSSNRGWLERGWKPGKLTGRQSMSQQPGRQLMYMSQMMILQLGMRHSCTRWNSGINMNAACF